MTVLEWLVRSLRREVSAGAWLDEVLAIAQDGNRPELLRLYTAASRHLGTTAFTPAGDVPLPASAAGYVFDVWAREDAGRLALLLARHGAGRHAASFSEDVEACYHEGDAREQRSWLRGAGLLPDPSQYLPLAIDACRTNILPLFEAIACENPYPARHFPERNFNQLVLKALFNGVALARVVGLETRANADLTRMAESATR
jgi:hypothetical protein